MLMFHVFSNQEEAELSVFVLFLQAKVEELKAELQVYNELKRRVEESMFKKDLQRNIQVCVCVYIKLKLNLCLKLNQFKPPVTTILKLFNILFRLTGAQVHSGSLSRSPWCL